MRNKVFLAGRLTGDYDGEVAARDYKKRPDHSGSGRWNNSIASRLAPTLTLGLFDLGFQLGLQARVELELFGQLFQIGALHKMLFVNQNKAGDIHFGRDFRG